MGHKSEKPDVITATVASREMSRILDRVAAGERFLIERHGRPVGMIGPAPIEGRRMSEWIGLLDQRPEVLLDDEFGADLLAIIEGEPLEERPWGS